MQKCPNCKHDNRLGVVFCENCGTSLIGAAPLGTKTFESKALSMMAETTLHLGSDVFMVGMLLKIVVDNATSLLLKFDRELVFGRKDPATGTMPDVDLTPFAGFRMGVSRRHAIIRHTPDNRLDLWDMGSSNGTFLNGTRLTPHRPFRLHDGDQIRLAQMPIQIYFQPAATS